MSDCIAGNQYIPSIEYFAHWMYHGQIILERHEHYQKRTWRNKTTILSPDRPLILTVPLQKGKHQQQKIYDVLVAYDEDWPRIHLNSIKTAYGKTAFSEEVVFGLAPILGANYSSLWELNLSCLRYVTSLIGGQWVINQTSEYHPDYPSFVVDLRAGIPGGVVSGSIRDLPQYPQVQRMYKSHLPNLCILDVLCHLGPETYPFLVRYANKLYDKP
jgi:WbqC-like protein family